MKHKIFLPLLIAIILFSCNKKNDSLENVVHLKGVIENSKNSNELLQYDGASSIVGNSRDLIIQTDDKGYIDTSFVLNEPAYFKLRGNLLYLSPGDDLTFRIGSIKEDTEFNGVGANANLFLRKVPSSETGSFLDEGKNVTGDFLRTKITIDSLAQIRQQQIDTLTGVSDEFKRLEYARTNANTIYSYLYYIYYGDLLEDTNPDSIWVNFMKSVAPSVKPILKEINDPTLLDIKELRDLFSFSSDSLLKEYIFNDIDLPTRTKEMVAGKEQSDKLFFDFTQETIENAANLAKTMENRDFANEIDIKVAVMSKLLPGLPAIDLELTDTLGNTKHLSDFKGKVIYVDFWATWCGPCRAESPHFESLAEQFKTEDILFIPISIDEEKKLWLDYLKENPKKLVQYHSTDRNLQDGWMVRFIPRFILIDKDFNIVNAKASAPSLAETKTTISQLLEKKI